MDAKNREIRRKLKSHGPGFHENLYPRRVRGSRSALALVASITLLSGCFGYNRSAKRWAYAGNAVLILGGGGVIASDVTTSEPPCTGDNCLYKSKIHGELVIGALLVAAGLAGIVFNVTRDNVKTSR
jgi:hypothetical protein